MQKFLIQTVLLILVIGVAMYVVFQPGTFNLGSGLSGGLLGTVGSTSSDSATPQNAMQIGNTMIKIEIADNDQTRAKGLSGRQSLASDSGMLFTFDKLDKYTFWMKGMQFALDFIFIKDNQVVDILQNIPPPAVNQSDDSLPLYAPITYVNKVVEVNSGFISANGIKVGDRVQLFNAK